MHVCVGAVHGAGVLEVVDTQVLDRVSVSVGKVTGKKEEEVAHR